MYLKQFGKQAKHDENLFVYLLDSQQEGGFVTWSAKSQRVPCYRTKCAKMWHVQSTTFLTNKEKLLTLGYPVTPGTALAMGVPILEVADCQRASSIAGNSFQFGAVGIIQLVALACLRDMTRPQESLLDVIRAGSKSSK